METLGGVPSWGSATAKDAPAEVDLNSLGVRFQETYERLVDLTNRIRNHADTLFGQRGEDAIHRAAAPEDNTLISILQRYEAIERDLRDQVNRF